MFAWRWSDELRSEVRDIESTHVAVEVASASLSSCSNALPCRAYRNAKQSLPT